MMIAAGKFKAQCLKILDDVQKNYREVVITKYGKPIAKLVGVSPKTRQPLFGSMKDSISIKGDIVSPDSATPITKTPARWRQVHR